MQDVETTLRLVYFWFPDMALCAEVRVIPPSNLLSLVIDPPRYLDGIANQVRWRLQTSRRIRIKRIVREPLDESEKPFENEVMTPSGIMVPFDFKDDVFCFTTPLTQSKLTISFLGM